MASPSSSSPSPLSSPSPPMSSSLSSCARASHGCASTESARHCAIWDSRASPDGEMLSQTA
eukprot:1109790-Pyramimonas_sp.AAC.1